MKLTACMMVKNESRLLPQCLRSIVDVVDEIVVVDTGSTDNTVHIAKDVFGAKVYHHPWENDFSLHRNQSLSYAKDADWVFIIDADERLETEINPDAFKRRLAGIPKKIGLLIVNTVEIINGAHTSWPGFRLLRMSSNPRYENIVHNKIKFDGYAAFTDITLRHFGYSLPEEEMDKKRHRTSQLLAARLEKDPDDFNAMYYMCQMAFGKKDFKECIKWGNRCRDLLPITSPEDLQGYAVLFYWMGLSHLFENDGNWAASWINKGLEHFPDDIDLNFAKCHLAYCADRKDWADEASERYFKAVEKLEQEKSGEFMNLIDQKDLVMRAVYSAGSDQQKNVREIVEFFNAVD